MSQAFSLSPQSLVRSGHLASTHTSQLDAVTNSERWGVLLIADLVLPLPSMIRTSA